MARTGLSVKGDGALKITIQKNGCALLTAVPLERIEWEHDPFDGTHYTAASISYDLPSLAEGARPSDRVLWRETHTVGRVEHTCFALETIDPDQPIFRIGKELTLDAAFTSDHPILKQPSYETGLDRLTLRKIPNFEVEGQFDGESDYTVSVIQLQRAITNLLSDYYKHLQARIFGGIIVLPRSAEGQARPQIAVVSGGVSDVRSYAQTTLRGPVIDRDRLPIQFEDREDRGATRYVNCEPNFDACVKELEILTRHLAWEMGIDTSGLFQAEGGSHALSGKALMLKLAPTLEVVAAKTTFIVPVIEEMLYDAQRFEMWHRAQIAGLATRVDGWPDRYEPTMPSVLLRDGLPQDEGDQVEMSNKRIAGKWLSRQTAIERSDDNDAEGARTELSRIWEEERMELRIAAESFEQGSGVMDKGQVRGAASCPMCHCADCAKCTCDDCPCPYCQDAAEASPGGAPPPMTAEEMAEQPAAEGEPGAPAA